MEDVKERIERLQREAEQLVNQRDSLYKTIKDIEIRLHQIVGAVTELNKIVQEGEHNEGS